MGCQGIPNFQHLQRHDLIFQPDNKPLSASGKNSGIITKKSAD